MELTTCCTGCSKVDPAGAGVCRSCGEVALRPLRDVQPAATGTPLIRSRLAEGLWLKVEGVNPTGTFKDRVMARLADEAVAQGSRGAIVASSGNAAVAAAAACLQRGLPLLVVVPATIDSAKLRPLRLRGTAVLRHGQDPSEAYALARFLAARYGLKELASTFHSSGTEYACRQIGHEIAAQLDTAPRAIAAAISVGPVLIGAGNGIVEVGGAPPALLAGQAAGCAPIAAAFEAEAEEVAPWTAPVATSAGSIADRLSGYPHEATFALRAIRSSGGSVGAWGDDDLHRFRELLAATDGVDIELASAAAVGAALDWHGPGPVVAVLTGAGWRETLMDDRPHPTPGTEAFQVVTGIDDLHEEIDRWTNSSS
jgi:threonine synthase